MNPDLNMALESEFQGVANEYPQNLLHTFFIKLDFPGQGDVNVSNYFNLLCLRLHVKYFYSALH